MHSGLLCFRGSGDGNVRAIMLVHRSLHTTLHVSDTTLCQCLWLPLCSAVAWFAENV
jgi:hypothetical protein